MRHISQPLIQLISQLAQQVAGEIEQATVAIDQASRRESANRGEAIHLAVGPDTADSAAPLDAAQGEGTRQAA